MYTWGNGKNGSLGHGEVYLLDAPKKIEGLENIVKIQCGEDFNIC